MQRQRPIGVTVLGALNLIGGFFLLVGGIGLFVAIPIITSNPDQFSIDHKSLAFEFLTGWLGYVLAGGLLALGIASIVIGIGLLKGIQWAWKAAVVIALISVATDVIKIIVDPSISNLTSSIIGWILDAVILYYLYRPHVKAYFGKSAEPTPL